MCFGAKNAPPHSWGAIKQNSVIYLTTAKETRNFAIQKTKSLFDLHQRQPVLFCMSLLATLLQHRCVGHDGGDSGWLPYWFQDCVESSQRVAANDGRSLTVCKMVQVGRSTNQPGVRADLALRDAILLPRARGSSELR